MIKASYDDKTTVVNILSLAFDTNKSINFIVKQDSKRKERVRVLMDYSFDICSMFGEILLTDDRKACALVLFPEKKRTTFKSLLLDARLAFNCIGITRIGKILKRETLIKSSHPKSPISYLWLLAVDPDAQNRGRGSDLIKYVIQQCIEAQRDIYLETSTLTNIPWYQKFNFKVTKELDLGYKLFILKRDFVN